MPSPADFLQTILVTGDDRIAFLQGQLSCNMTNAEGSIQLATMCNPKGRIIAIFHVICGANAIFLTARADHIEPASMHLKRFVFRSKVEITHQHSVRIFLADAATVPENRVLLPGTIEEPSKNELRARLNNPSALELTLTSNSIEDVTGNSDTKTNSLNAESFWSYHMHASGIPELSLGQSEQYLPEPLNLDLSGGINFEKGCYTGQEVIARMHYLGKAKKRLFQFTSNESAAITAGMPVYDQQGTSVGEIFSVFIACNNIKEYVDTDSTPELKVQQGNLGDLKEATVIGLAILTNQSTESSANEEARPYWIKQTSNASKSVSIAVTFPKY